MAGRQSLVDFNLVNDLGDEGQVIGARHLGYRDGVDLLADAFFQVAHREPPGPVDAHQHVEAVAGDLRGRAGHRAARARLLGSGTLSSRSRMMASAPRVWALATNFSTCAGTNSAERQAGNGVLAVIPRSSMWRWLAW